MTVIFRELSRLKSTLISVVRFQFLRIIQNIKQVVACFLLFQCAFLPALTFALTTNLNNTKFRNIEDQKFGEIGQIWSIAEDNQGFIWVSGARGAARFDGLNLKVYQSDNQNPYSIPESYITEIFLASNGRLWFATHKGLYLYEYETDRFYKKPLLPGDGSEVKTLWNIEEDKDGNLWLGFSGTGIGRFNPKTEEFTHFPKIMPNKDDGSYPSSYGLLIDQAGNIWAGSEVGLSRYNPATNQLKRFSYDVNDPYSIGAGTISSLLQDRKKNIWIGMSDGLFRYDAKNDRFDVYRNRANDNTSLAGDHVSDIVMDHEGSVWVVSDGGGLSLYDAEHEHFHQFRAEPGVLGSVKYNSIRTAYVSRSGDLWLGYHPFGVAVSDRYAKAINTFTFSSENPNTISSNIINALMESKPGELWAGTEKGVNRINLDTGDVTRFEHIPGKANSLSSNAVLTVLLDSSNRMWAGTWGGGLNRYDFDTQTYTHIKSIPGDPNSLPDNRVWIVKERDKDTLWVGTQPGLSIYHIHENRFERFPSFQSRVGNILFYRDKYLFAVDDNMMRILDMQTLETVEEPKVWHALPRITNAVTTPAGNLWINTEKGFRWQKDLASPVESFPEIEEQIGQYYSQMVVDRDGDLWLGNSSGITVFDPVTTQLIQLNSEHGLPGDSFRMPRASILLSDGRVAMGGAEGIAIIDPEKIKINDVGLKPVLSGLKILDLRVSVDQPNSPIKKVVNLADEITLDYHQNVFSIEYTALDYQLTKKNTFAFRLKGFDSGWRNVGVQRVATYTNLDPGRYTFEVKSANDQGVWSQDVASIDVVVLPPWWLTWYAYTGYTVAALLFLGLVGFVVWSSHQRTQQSRINQKLQELDRLKDDFMAKTSHELRTPLNGIIGLTESIILGATGPIADSTREKLQVVVSSGKRLSNIINDILDFSKLRNHEIVLNKSKVDMYTLVDSILVLSQSLLGQKSVELINRVPKNMGLISVDEQRITQVLFNLIGNAIKFTASGSVTVSAQQSESAITVSVADTGQGISEKDLERIFQPFEQSIEGDGAVHVGTGLGLTVSRQLIELHGGSINVTSTLAEGSVFSFILPRAQRSDTSAEVLEPEYETERHISPAQRAPVVKMRSSKPEIHPDSVHRVLIVDDEPVNRLVLETYLGDQYFDITEAATGGEALDMLRSGKKFDLVLLDVMMPGMSGYETCVEMRKQFSMCDLPVVFLTAKSQLEDLKMAYQVGGNDFLYKPVVREEFLAKVSMHLKMSDQFQQQLGSYNALPKSQS